MSFHEAPPALDIRQVCLILPYGFSSREISSRYLRRLDSGVCPPAPSRGEELQKRRAILLEIGGRHQQRSETDTTGPVIERHDEYRDARPDTHPRPGPEA